MRKILLAILLAAPLLANTQFTIRRMTRNDVPLGKGQCDIRLQVDGEAEVSVEGDRVFARTISGRDPRDDGSECNEPLPRDPQNSADEPQTTGRWRRPPDPFPAR